jgi:integrase
MPTAAQKIVWNQVDLKHRVIRLYETKNGSPRVVPLRPRILAMLSGVPKEKRIGPVFYQGAFRKTWMSASIAARVPVPGTDGVSCKKKGKYIGLIVHDLRRSARRNMSLVGDSETDIMAISGHKTNATFRRYNIVSLQQMQDLAARVEQHEQQARASQPALVGEVVFQDGAFKESCKFSASLG